MPEREKSDLLHAGNLLISMFVCERPRSCVDGFGYFKNRGPASERQHNAARGNPLAKSPHNGATRRVAVVRFEMAPAASGSQRLSHDPRHGLRDASVGAARWRAQSAKARSERSETKVEPLCQFCVSWHTPSRSVLLEMAGITETDDRAKTRVVLDFQGVCERMDGAARQD
jgi:hypothetical protein